MKLFNRLILGMGLVLTLSGCSYTSPAEPTILRYLNDGAPRTDGGTPQLADFRIHRTLPWSDGTAVFYTVRDVSDDRSDQVGYIIFERTLFGWKPQETGVFIRPANSVTPEQHIEYVSGGGQQRNANYALVVGRVLDPQVAIIEATLDNKEVLRDTPTDNVFAFLSEKAHAVCEIRLFKVDGKVIQTIRPTPSVPQCTA